LHYALGRFEGRVNVVTARLADLNGPRGGVDKRCRISVAVRAGDPVLVEDADTDLYAAIDRAAERAGRAVWRQLARRREMDMRHDASKSA
jgi:ribosome-associated translation inhibitor RaiA